MIIILYITAFIAIIRFVMFLFKKDSTEQVVKEVDYSNSHTEIVKDNLEDINIETSRTEESIPKQPDLDILNTIQNIKYDGTNLEECLEYCKKQIEYIKLLDKNFEASFGWQYNYRIIDEQEILLTEAEIKRKLPLEFREFIKTIGFGFPRHPNNTAFELDIEKRELYGDEGDTKPINIMFSKGYIIVYEQDYDDHSTRLCLANSNYGEIWNYCYGRSEKICDNYIDWHIRWVNYIITVFAHGEFINFRAIQFGNYIYS
jgi:hypothetical protein